MIPATVTRAFRHAWQAPDTPVVAQMFGKPHEAKSRPKDCTSSCEISHSHAAARPNATRMPTVCRLAPDKVVPHRDLSFPAHPWIRRSPTPPLPTPADERRRPWDALAVGGFPAAKRPFFFRASGHPCSEARRTPTSKSLGASRSSHQWQPCAGEVRPPPLSDLKNEIGPQCK